MYPAITVVLYVSISFQEAPYRTSFLLGSKLMLTVKNALIHVALPSLEIDLRLLGSHHHCSVFAEKNPQNVFSRLKTLRREKLDDEGISKNDSGMYFDKHWPNWLSDNARIFSWVSSNFSASAFGFRRNVGKCQPGNRGVIFRVIWLQKMPLLYH